MLRVVILGSDSQIVIIPVLSTLISWVQSADLSRPSPAQCRSADAKNNTDRRHRRGHNTAPMGAAARLI
ncbi:hypothetical protein EVAR_98022_1 [Eumeta japonica]|uniref:Uncharacterized protein n=1 Tax=Eumeta variegata TaxID=151549 RepID=A0A4C2A954_EUMVA|nr:hypothetical protein EVAR_98022_1 [Eumeta japonica]